MRVANKIDRLVALAVIHAKYLRNCDVIDER